MDISSSIKKTLIDTFVGIFVCFVCYTPMVHLIYITLFALFRRFALLVEYDSYLLKSWMIVYGLLLNEKFWTALFSFLFLFCESLAEWRG